MTPRQVAEHVRTLAGAHVVLSQLAPPPWAPPEVRRDYHLWSADVYRRVAEVDTRHHYEALACAEVERDIYAPRAVVGTR